MTSDRPDKKQRAILQFRSIGFEQEGIDSYEECISNSLDFFGAAHKESPLPPMISVQFSGTSIQQFSLPFHELVASIKKRYWQSHPLIDTATDIGLTFDYHEGEVFKHSQLGPMEPQQLKSGFLKWPIDDLPDCFAYVSLSYTRNREIGFEIGEVKEVLDQAMEWQISQARSMLADLSSEKE